ncbi:MAG: hypothetical protein KDD62_08815 [Bdellovibrionales bacterium]|nr:hypothetical protein [Bdellovibrionales bacterium]
MRTLNTVMIDADSETQEGGSEGMVQVCQHQRVYRQLDELDHELRCMQRSPSWRITQFLRNKKALMGCLLSWVPFVSHTLSFVREENGSFSVRSNRKLLPNSWVSLQVTQSDLSGTLYIDRGDGFLEHDSMPLDIGRGQSCLIKLPALVRGMRFDSGEALIEPIRVTQLYSFLPLSLPLPSMA